MTKAKKAITITISVVLSIVLVCLLSAYFLFLNHYKGTTKTNAWSESDTFEISSIKTMQKKPDKDFVILNLADVQMADLEDIFHYGTIKSEIEYLISKTKPDLITLTGDQTWSNENLISLTSLVRWLDGYKIPYAPIFGNHDYGNQKNSAVLSQNACCDIYEKGKYCLFDRGPSNLGTLGNYIVNIVEDGKICKTLYMLDSGYEDKITDEQIAWMSWNADGIKAANNNQYSEGMVFLHKPLPEYRYAYNALSNEQKDAIDPYYNYSLYGSEQNGFFDMAKTKNITDIICGHQHGNNFTLTYEGVRLTFALKTGELGGYIQNDNVYLNGATYITLSGTLTTIEHHYVPRGKFHI